MTWDVLACCTQMLLALRSDEKDLAASSPLPYTPRSRQVCEASHEWEILFK